MEVREKEMKKEYMTRNEGRERNKERRRQQGGRVKVFKEEG